MPYVSLSTLNILNSQRSTKNLDHDLNSHSHENPRPGTYHFLVPRTRHNNNKRRDRIELDFSSRTTHSRTMNAAKSNQSFWPWRSTGSSLSVPPCQNEDDVETHRKRLAQILRYISSMQSQNAAEGQTFVRTSHDNNFPSPFFQDDNAMNGIIFTTYNFQRLCDLENDLSFQSPPYTFYTASALPEASRKRTANGTRKASTEVAPSSSCWLRLTRPTTEAAPLPCPAAMDYLRRWNDRIGGEPRNSLLTSMDSLLTWENLKNPPKTTDVQVKSFLRRYKKFLRKRDFQLSLEPLYNRLFEWLQDQHEDLIWGLGHATMRQEEQKTVVSGPILEVRVEVELARDGALLVRPKEHTGVALNRDVMATLATCGEAVSRNLNQSVDELDTSQLAPGEPTTYIPLLKRMAVELSSGGTFASSTTIAAHRSAMKQGLLVVTDAWCLYSRPKPSAIWARDSAKFVELLSREDAIHVLPKALWSLTHGPGILDRFENHESGKQVDSSYKNPAIRFLKAAFSSRDASAEDGGMSPPRLLFPLPTSQAQNQLADLLLTKNYPAVVCEGPPGTGKTHTIANIISAYLCQGKRVLVTSKGAPALSVLRERLPPSLQELCVDVSMSESVGMRQLQQTVERLANKVSWASTEHENSRSQALMQNIDELEKELRGIESTLAAHSENIRDIIQKPTGQELCEKALLLVESYPWLMKSLANWTTDKTSTFHLQTASLLVEQDDRIELVEGYKSPPSQALITLAASNAGESISILKNAAKGVIASLPLIGLAVSKDRQDLQESLDGIHINGVPPSSKADWKLVLSALQRDQAIHSFHQTILEPMSVLEGWPVDEFYHPNTSRRRLRRGIVDSFNEALRVKKLACDLQISDKINLTVQVHHLDSRRTVIAKRVQQLVAELVDATVVAEMSRAFSAEAQSALIKFAQIAGKAKFGKSTNASKMTQRQRRHRQEYLDAFEKCVRYIPCWILTSSQISDYLPSECLFDLVILDEASQSDVTVLPGMLRGKQWLIVGDGKQVSPTDGFVAEEHIERLKAVLPQSPLEDSLLPGHSFFDLCAQAYPKGRVILREHFRCAPEIVSFSNHEFYGGSLIPLRLPTSSERLEPSLIDMRIANGIKIGKTNERECDRIVSEVKAIVASSLPSNRRTIGIISLMGDEQSRLIRGRLLEAIGPKGFKEHNVLIGDPPTFQGAERDIVFLSLVCSPGSVPTQNQLMHAQRVNVALSRARDRMVLVRSIDANHIPNEQDIKFAVLDFFERATLRNTGRLSDEAHSQNSTPQSNMRSRPASSPVGAQAERVLKKLLQARGFSLRAMGDIWAGAICVENPSSGVRAGICVDGCGETQDEWSKLVGQQKSIERVGWKCLRVSAISLVHDYYACLQLIIRFLNAVGVHPSRIEHDKADVEVLDAESEIEAEVPEVPQGGVPEVQDGDDIIMVSSDDESDSEDAKPAAVKTPFTSSYTESLGNGEAASDYGNAVDLGFLRPSNPTNHFARGVSMEDAESQGIQPATDHAYASLRGPAAQTVASATEVDIQGDADRPVRTIPRGRNNANADGRVARAATRQAVYRDDDEDDRESETNKSDSETETEIFDVSNPTAQIVEGRMASPHNRRDIGPAIVAGQEQARQNSGPDDRQFPDQADATFADRRTSPPSRASGALATDAANGTSGRADTGDQGRRRKRKPRTKRDDDWSPDRPVQTVVQDGTESVDEDLSSSCDSDSDLDFIENESTARSRLSRASKRSRRLDKYSRDGRWYPKRYDSDDEDHMLYEPLAADDVTEQPVAPQKGDEGKLPSEQQQNDEQA